MEHCRTVSPKADVEPRQACASDEVMPLLAPGSHGLLANASVPKVRLDELVDVRPGLTFACPVRDDPHGTIHVLSMRGLPAAGHYDGAAGSTVRMVPPRPNTAPYEIRPGDVLLVSRATRTDGMTHRAVAVTACAEQTVAAHSLLILRPRPEAGIEPRYLAWYLNEASVQRSLESRSQGGTTTLLPSDAVGEIEVPVAPRRTQEAIIGCAETAATLEDLAQKQLEARRAMTRAITHQLVHGRPALQPTAVSGPTP